MPTSEAVVATPTATGPIAPQATAGLLALGTVVAGTLNYAFALLLIRGLSVNAFRVFAGSQALLVITGVIGSAGIPWVVAREVAAAAGNADRRRRSITFAFWASVTLGIAASVVVTVIAMSFAPLADAVLVGATALVLSIGSVGMGTLQGDGRTARMALLFAAEVMVKVTFGTLAVFVLNWGSLGAVSALFLGGTVLLVSLRGMRTDIGRPRRFSSDRSLWRASARIGTLQVAVGILSALDILLVAGLTPTRAHAASWQVASAIGKVPLFIAGALSTAVFPGLRAPDADRRRTAALRSYAAVAAFGCILLYTVPGAITEIAFPSSYSSVTSWLPWTAALGAGLGLFNLFTTFIQGEDSGGPGLRPSLAVVGAELFAAVVGGLVFGMHGFAVGTVAAVWLGDLLLLLSHISVRVAARSFVSSVAHWKYVTSTLACAGAMYFTARSPLLWTVAAATLGFWVLIIAFPELRPRLGTRHDLLAQQE